MNGPAPTGYHVYCPMCARVLGRFSTSLGDDGVAYRRAVEYASGHFHTTVKVLQGYGERE
jgi:hypothetical protein